VVDHVARASPRRLAGDGQGCARWNSRRAAVLRGVAALVVFRWPWA
jgi:hypothetical protein